MTGCYMQSASYDAKMGIRAACPGCQRQFLLRVERAGKKVRCNKCGAAMEAPSRTASWVVPASEEPKPPKPAVNLLPIFAACLVVGVMCPVFALALRPAKPQFAESRVV